MMPIARNIQTSWGAGEADPLFWSREDVKFFYSSCRKMQNALPLPQGGFRRRDGWRFRSPQRGALTFVSFGSTTPTAPNGGTAANVTDGNPATLLTTTTGIGTTATYVVFALDFGSDTRISCIDVFDLQVLNLPAGIEAVEMEIQSSSDGVAWGDTGATLNVGATAYDRRFARAPDNEIGNERHYRLVVKNSIDLGTATVQLSGASGRREEGFSDAQAESEFALFRITTSAEDEYIVYLTGGSGVNVHADIFRADTGAWVAAQAMLNHKGSQLSSLRSAGYLDSLLFFHPDAPPWIMQRIGEDSDWKSEALAFESVTRFPFADENVSGGVNEIQILDFSGMAAGVDFVFEFNGQSSSVVTWNATMATNATNMEAALESIADITSVSCTYIAGTVFQVEFTGVDGLRAWPALVVDMLTGSGTVDIGRKQRGQFDTDDLWSATRGYPSTGAFYQGRLYMGGFKARKDVIASSRAGSLLDFKEDVEPAADSPLVIVPNADENVEIEHIFPGRHLQIFTSGGEMYVPNEPIKPDNIGLKITSRHGAAPTVRPVDIQGGTIFIDREGTALREYLFVDAEQSYSAEPISFLAGHLVAQPYSMALSRSKDEDDPTMLLLANTGVDRAGNAVPSVGVVVDRSQEITGFFRFVTDGTPLAFETSQAGAAFVVVERELAAGTWRWLEQFEAGALTDAGTTIANASMEDFTATSGQTVFTYTFGSPSTEDDLHIWRLEGVHWVRVPAAEIVSISLGTQTVTLTPQAEGARIRINARRNIFQLTSDIAHLIGETVALYSDGVFLEEKVLTSPGTTLSAGLYWDFEIEIGLPFDAEVVLHPYKGRGEPSPTMQRQRIFRALIQVDRTSDLTLAVEGGAARPVPLEDSSSGEYAPTAEEARYSGETRMSGLPGWHIEPRLVLAQATPNPLTVRSVTYDVRT